MAGETETITQSQEEINNALIQGQATNTAAIAAETTRAMAAEKRIKMCINYRGTVANTGLLPATGNTKGDFFFVSGTNHWYLWEGTAWIDNGVVTAGMSAYDIAVAHGYTGTEAEWIAEQAKWTKLGNVPDGTTAQAEITALDNKIGTFPEGTTSVSQALTAQTAAVTQQLATQNTNVQNLMAQAVKITTDQTISGVKTFSSSPLIPTSEVTEQNNYKTVNVEMLMTYIAQNEISSEILKIVSDSNLSSLYEGTTVTFPTILFVDKIAIFCPEANILLTSGNPGFSANNNVRALGRCSFDDIKNHRLYLDATNISGQISSNTNLVISKVQEIEFPNATSVLNIRFCSSYDTDTETWTKLTVNKLIIPNLQSSNPFVKTVTDFIDFRNGTKAQFDTMYMEFADESTTNCIARCSDGYLKYNGNDWVDYTPAS